MANAKISALTGATTPLAGTEVLPIVQGGATKQVSVANLTLGRSVQLADFIKITGSLTPVMVGTSTSVGQLVVNRNPVTGVFDDTSKAACYINLNSEVGGSYIGIYTTTLNNTNPTLRFTFNSSGDLVPAAAKGINFSNNTPAAGKTSTTLTSYEEGTWTPNQGAGLTLVGSFSSAGTYTRIGRQVSIAGTVTGATSVAVTAAGVITSNLPFTVVSAGHGGATNVAINASSTVICTGTSVTSAGAIAATATITFSATYFV